MAADDLGDDVHGFVFFVRHDFKSVAAKEHRPFSAVKSQSAHARAGSSGGAFAKLADRLEVGIFDNRVLHVWDFAVVLEKAPPADAGHGRRTFHIDAPINDVQ